MRLKRTTEIPLSRPCTKCKVDKPLECFNNSKNGLFGKFNECRDCLKVRNGDYRQKKFGEIEGKVMIYTLSLSDNPDLVVYVGKCTNPVDRLRFHYNSINNKCNNYLHLTLKPLIEKGQTLILNIIDHCPKDDWERYEEGYILLYKSSGCSLLNRNNGGRNKGYKGSPRPELYRPVVMLDKKTGERIREFASMTIAIDYLGKPRTGVKNIGMCARGEKPSMYGYKWAYL